jgi:enamine deaminase RidA (YjgF/YER057c/UK114 family)
MLKRHNPPAVHAPVGKYSHAVEARPGGRWVFISGQVGIRKDGSIAAGAEAQCEQAWNNVIAALGAVGMGANDIVKLNAYVTRPDVVPSYRAARDRIVGTAPSPASTLVVVAALVDPALLVEIECVAAKEA